MNITPNTELAAVNRILFTIGASPVNSLAESSVDIVNARTQLSYSSAMVQAKGWTFNIQENMFVQSDAFSNQIIYRPSWLKVTSSGSQSPYINKAGFLYDRLSNTDRFPGGTTIDVIELQPFDELPLCFQAYITEKAAWAFNSGAFGDPQTAQDVATKMEEARVMCGEYELDYADLDLFTNPFIQGRLGRR